MSTLSANSSKRLFRASRGQGEDMVVLHGWGLHSVCWTDLLAHYCDRYRVTYIDLPGFGKSRDITAVELDDIVAALVSVAPPKAHWLGWSYGGLLAQVIASRYPARVRSLYLVASSVKFVRAPDWPAAIESAVFSQFMEQLQADYDGALRRFLALQTRASEDAGATLRTLRSYLKDAPAADPLALQTGLRLLRDLDLRHAFARLGMPVGLLFGGKDTIVPVTACEALQRLLPASETIIIPGAGHAPFLSHPQAFSTALDGFLQRVAKSGAIPP